MAFVHALTLKDCINSHEAIQYMPLTDLQAVLVGETLCLMKDSVPSNVNEVAVAFVLFGWYKGKEQPPWPPSFISTTQEVAGDIGFLSNYWRALCLAERTVLCHYRRPTPGRFSHSFFPSVSPSQGFPLSTPAICCSFTRPLRLAPVQARSSDKGLWYGHMQPSQ